MLLSFGLYAVFIPAHVLQEAQWEYKALHEHVLTQYLSTYRQADYLSWLFYRLNVEVVPMLLNLPFSIFPVFSMLLFGLYTAKKDWYIISNKIVLFQENSVNNRRSRFHFNYYSGHAKNRDFKIRTLSAGGHSPFTSLSGIFLCFLSYHLTVIPAIFSLCFNAGSF